MVKVRSSSVTHFFLKSYHGGVLGGTDDNVQPLKIYVVSTKIVSVFRAARCQP